MPLTLKDLGWNEFFAQAFLALENPSYVPGRIIRETKINFSVLMDEGEECDAVLSGKLWHETKTDAELPTVGDWVAVDFGKDEDLPVIRGLLPRKTCFSRKAPGKTTAEQVIGTNLDYVIIVTDAGADYNLRRMERYLTLIQRSGASPIILINKMDETPKDIMNEVKQNLSELLPGTPIYPISALDGTGFAPVKKLIKKGVTISIVGSSGVGKSTLINALLEGEWMETGEVNDVTGKGRHTTVARELVVLRKGGILIDNPGMREIQMWTDEATLRASFADLEELSRHCKFADCSHGSDEGCAIRQAVDAGELDSGRYEGYLRLEDEVAELLKRSEKRQMTVERIQKRRGKNTLRNYEDREDQRNHHRPHRR